LLSRGALRRHFATNHPGMSVAIFQRARCILSESGRKTEKLSKERFFFMIDSVVLTLSADRKHFGVPGLS
jgi:hypothetical protein